MEKIKKEYKVVSRGGQDITPIVVFGNPNPQQNMGYIPRKHQIQPKGFSNGKRSRGKLTYTQTVKPGLSYNVETGRHRETPQRTIIHAKPVNPRIS